MGENSKEESVLLRLLTPVAKLWTAKMAMAVTSEGIESFGGAGYIEDTGLPVLLRNAQVFSIWEGTTNVLSLDVLRVIEKSPEALKVLSSDLRRLTLKAEKSWPQVFEGMQREIKEFESWLEWLKNQNPEVWQTHARHLAFRMAELYSRALLLDLAESASHSAPFKALLGRISTRPLPFLPR